MPAPFLIFTKPLRSNRMLSSVYQPIVSLKDGSVHAYEALSRITYEDATINISHVQYSPCNRSFLP